MVWNGYHCRRLSQRKLQTAAGSPLFNFDCHADERGRRAAAKAEEIYRHYSRFRSQHGLQTRSRRQHTHTQSLSNLKVMAPPELGVGGVGRWRLDGGGG